MEWSFETLTSSKAFNDWLLIGIALFVTFIMSGFASQIGVLVGPIAESQDVDVAAVAGQFTYLTGGIFVGLILSFVIFDYVSIRAVLLGSYSLILVFLAGLYFWNDALILSVFLAVVGTILGITMCAGGAVVAQAFFDKKRQAILVTQDATYNLAGAIVPVTTSFFIASGLSWTWGYLSIGFFILIVILLVSVSRFDFEAPEAQVQNVAVEWNAGIFLAGVCLFLFMLAQITLIIWLPQFAEQQFAVASDRSGELITNLYSAALVSALVAVYVAHKVNIIYVLYVLVSLGLICSILITQVGNGEDLFGIAILLGISVSATFNSLVAYGLLFVASPKHKNVTFLIFASGLGTAVAPLISSELVTQFSSTRAAIVLCVVLYSGILIVLLFNSFSGRQLQYSKTSN